MEIWIFGDKAQFTIGAFPVGPSPTVQIRSQKRTTEPLSDLQRAALSIPRSSLCTIPCDDRDPGGLECHFYDTTSNARYLDSEVVILWQLVFGTLWFERDRAVSSE